MPNHFQVLGIPVTAGDQEVHEACRRKRQEYKDQPAKLREVEEAYAVLSNPITRKRYRLNLPPDTPEKETEQEQSIPASVTPAPGPARGGTGTDPSKRGVRSNTVMLGDEPTPAGSPPGKKSTGPSPTGPVGDEKPAPPAGSSPAKGRSKTQVFDGSPASQPATPAKPPVETPRPGGKSKRSKTEIFVAGQDQVSKGVPTPPEQKPSRSVTPTGFKEQPGSKSPRPKTEIIGADQNQAAADQKPAPLISPAESGKHPGGKYVRSRTEAWVVGQDQEQSLPVTPDKSEKQPKGKPARSRTEAWVVGQDVIQPQKTPRLVTPPEGVAGKDLEPAGEETIERIEGASAPSSRVKVTIELDVSGGMMQYALLVGENLIGRPSASITLNIPIHDPYVSRKHAVIHFNGKECFIEDRESKNGTQVNGKLIEKNQRTLLKDGDVIRIETHTLRIKYG